jgi:hypothetical protein
MPEFEIVIFGDEQTFDGLYLPDGQRCLLNMRYVTICPSLAVSRLLEYRDRVVLFNCTPMVKQVLAVLGVDRVLRVADTFADAVALAKTLPE